MSDDHIVTAAHCLTQDPVVIYSGSLCQGTAGIRGSGYAPVTGPPIRQPAGDDVAFVRVDATSPTSSVRLGRPILGIATVWSYGVSPSFGRPSCQPQEYSGLLGPCGLDAPAAEWCLDVPAAAQVCGGSSGSPVFVDMEAGQTLVGVISGGPRCGEPGPIIVAALPTD